MVSKKELLDTIEQLDDDLSLAFENGKDVEHRLDVIEADIKEIKKEIFGTYDSQDIFFNRFGFRLVDTEGTTLLEKMNAIIRHLDITVRKETGVDTIKVESNKQTKKAKKGKK